MKAGSRKSRWVIGVLFLSWLVAPGALLDSQPRSEDGYIPGSSAAAPLRNDIGRLRRVIVLTPGGEMRRMTLLASGDHPGLADDEMQPGAISQHRGFIRVLQEKGVEVLSFENLLDSALRLARERRVLREWLRKNFPRTPELWKQAEEVTASDLIGRGRYFYHYSERGTFNPLVWPQKWLYYTRDSAVMTPHGLVITRFANYDRAMDATLMEFAFRYAPELAAYPVAFDAGAEDVFVQGGDVMTLDEHTLLVGTGNLSEPQAAERLAQKLNMEVLGVSLPRLAARKSGYSGFTGVNLQFLHLDTFFTLVDRKKAVAVPYVLEARYAEQNPLVGLLARVEEDSRAMELADLSRHKNSNLNIAAARRALGDIGWVTRYEAGTGRATALKKKLADVLLERGYTIIPAGGEKGAMTTEEYLLERVLFELNFQAANVVALRPGVVAAYAENVYTIAALRKAGVEVLPFDGAYLAMWHGGPHCLTLPLERDP
jgi:arginine deiminase